MFGNARGKALFFPVCLSFSFSLIAGYGADAQSAPTDSMRVEEILNSLNRGRNVAQVAISPDGKRLAWIEGPTAGSTIWVAPVEDTKKTKRVTAATKPGERCRESEIAWEPDSKALAFFSDCAAPDDQMDLYLSRLDGNPARRLTELRGYESSPAFSPDGTRIAFLYVEGATRPAGALAAMKPSSGVIGEDGLEIQRVAMVPVNANAAAPEKVTPAKLHVYEFDWALDSKRLAYVAADPPGENNWWIAKLYTQGLGGEAKAILAPAEIEGPLHGLQIAVPRWSPDGQAIAFIGGLMSDQGATGGDVWIISAEGGAPQDITTGRPTSPAWVEWSTKDTLFVSELAGGNSQLMRFKLQQDDATGRIRTSFGSPIFSIPGTVSDGRLELSLSSAADRSMFVFSASTFDRPMEIYAAKPGTVMTSGLEGVIQLTHLNDGIEPAWGTSVSLSWKSDAFRVQGWLMLPKDYDPAKKYPLIVEVHGGPASAIGPQWGSRGGISAQALSARRIFCPAAQPARKLRPGRRVYASEPEGLRLRRSARHSGRCGCGAGQVSCRPKSCGSDRMELRRLYDDVCRDANESVQGGGDRRGHLGLAELLRRKLDRPVDDSLLWRIGV